MPKTKKPSIPIEYLLVSDKDSRVLRSSENRYDIVKLANIIRRGGGEVTVFKSTRM